MSEVCICPERYMMREKLQVVLTSLAVGTPTQDVRLWSVVERTSKKIAEVQAGADVTLLRQIEVASIPKLF